MLCLFETPAGFALFKVLDHKRISNHETLWEEFETPAKAAALVKLKAFSKFDNTKDAVAAAANLVWPLTAESGKSLIQQLQYNLQFMLVDVVLGARELSSQCKHSVLPPRSWA
jgi:hypothetical protein